MKIFRVIFAGLALVVFISGCVQMRDYTGSNNGSTGLEVENRFGPGAEAKKDYYVVKDGDGIIIGDTKNEVIAMLGLPDEVKTTLEGYEYWIYAERNLKLFFSQDRLKEWEEF